MRYSSYSNPPPVKLTGRWIRESAKALQFLVHTINGEPLVHPVDEWFPFSQVSKIFNSDLVTRTGNTDPCDWIIATNWIVGQKNLFNKLANSSDHSDPVSTEQNQGESNVRTGRPESKDGSREKAERDDWDDDIPF